ncbi:MAG: hypothetical protein VW974_06650 [Hyphomicrobiales bacterium]
MKRLFLTLTIILALPLTIISVAKADIYDDLQSVFLADDQILYDETMSALELQLNPLQIAYNESELSYNSINDDYNLLIDEQIQIETELIALETTIDSLIQEQDLLENNYNDLNLNLLAKETELESYLQIFSVLSPEDPEYAELQNRISLAESDIADLSTSIDETQLLIDANLQNLETTSLSQIEIENTLNILTGDIEISSANLSSALELFELAGSELNSLLDQINQTDVLYNSELTAVTNQLLELNDDQLDALNRSLKNVYDKKDRVLLISSDDLSLIIENDYNKKQINDLTKAYEIEEKFISKGYDLLLKAEEKNNDKFLELAQKAFDNADKQKSKFLEKIEKEEIKKEKKASDAAKKAEKKASDKAKKAEKKAAKEAKKKDK